MQRKWIAFILLITGLLTACQPIAAPASAPAAPAPSTASGAPTANLTDSCVNSYDANVDYFPEKTTLTHTSGFSVEYHNHYKVVIIQTPWQGAEPIQYALVQCGAPAPEGFDASAVIEVPVQRFVGMSTTYLPFLDELGLLDRLVGLDDTAYVSNEKVLKLAADGKIKTIGYGASVNIEQTLELDPDLVMTFAIGSADADAHPKLQEAGLKVVINAEWLETSPLGRAEWGKFMALFFNQEAAAQAMFDQTATRYAELQRQVATLSARPTVFTDSAYQGTWYAPGGQSFGARFLADAGATYLWSDDPSTGSLPLAFEAVFDKAKDAQFWLNLGYVNSLEELKAADARYADFTAFQSGNVWNNNARTNVNGGNDYYESAVAHPDVVLADLIKILHPDLLPAHELVYYQQLK